jgi:GlcNAc-P-P-Und epimerase
MSLILITGGSGFIGTNLIDMLLENNYTVLNIDLKAPYKHEHDVYWKECNILDFSKTKDMFEKFQPEYVVHLAAKTDTDPHNTLEDYKVNTEGTNNVIECIKSIQSIKRVIITSTQFVFQAEGLQPQYDEDYWPHTIYGESKVIAEQETRKANLTCAWTIIRPTNVWGPWHLRYPYEFWKTLSQGLYIHPSGKKVVRSYAYIGNVVWQIQKILMSEVTVINKKTFYVGDEPIDLKDWVNGFSLRQIGRNVIVVPRALVKVLSYLGDIFKKIGIKFPITSSRYKSMTTSNAAPMRKTIDTFGPPPYSLEEGIRETVEWIKEYHPQLIKLK